MPGKALSHFKVIAKIGEGGMGEVYRAVDEKLDREVALKMLPSHLDAEPERLERFRREAKAVASLNHPGIGAIYGLEEEAGITFLVLELVEGEDLSDRLRRGPLPLTEAIRIAVELATALEVAHEHGIVHRDLKPSNIKLTADDKPKILDFGLAKIYTPDDPLDLEDGLSPTALRVTEAGTVLGTAAYMAPEQAEGACVDKRADIWAFGVVLFEMLTGRQLFGGSSFRTTLLAVQSQEIEWGRLPRETPRHVRRILERCLCRDRLERLRDIGEARIRLQHDPDPDGMTAQGGRHRRPRFRTVLAAGVGVVALTLAGFFAGRAIAPGDRANEPRALKLDLELEGLSLRDLGEAFEGPKISPNGRQLLYTAADGLMIRRLTELEAVVLPGTDGAKYPFWSPDGNSIAYIRAGRLWRRSATPEGPATDLGAVPDDLLGSGGGAWNAAGQLVLAGSPSAGLIGFTEDGRILGELVAVAEEEADFHEVSPLPDGRGFLFTVHGPEGIDSIAALVDGRRKEILRMPGESLAFPSYSPTGHLVYERETVNPGLWAARFSVRSMEVVGAPFPVIPNATMPSRAGDGSLVFVRREHQRAELVKVGRDGSMQLHTVLSAPSRFGSRGWLDLSPEGRRLAVPLDARPYGDLWVVDLKSGTQARVDTGWVGSVRPVWTQDSSRLIYASLKGTESTWKAWIAWTDGTKEPERLELDGADIIFPLAVSPDGRWLVYSADQLLAIRIDDPAERLTIARDIGQTSVPAASFSPDGKWLAYHLAEAGSHAIWIQPFPPDGRRFPVSIEEGAYPRWSSSGAELLYRHGPRMMAVDFETGAEPNLSRPRELFSLFEDSGLSQDFEPLPKDDGFLMVRSRGLQRVTFVLDFDSLIAEAEQAQRSTS